MKKRNLRQGMIVALGLLFIAVASAPAGAQTYQVFSSNDSGMHCMDSNFSLWAILPPGNFMKAQVIQKGSSPQLLSNATVRVTYRAIADATGSINTTSSGKTNFWQFVSALYGRSLVQNTGFLGFKMPGAANTPQPMSAYDAAIHRFSAHGVPITPKDDAGLLNPYPLMRVEAKNAAGTVLSGLSTVVPVSWEMHCNDCHATGKVAATGRGITWSTLTNVSQQTKANVLLLHNAVVGTNLLAPVACASCHYSAATDLELNGTLTTTNLNPPDSLSRVMHLRHGTPTTSVGSSVPIPNQGIKTCYYCHPGQNTKCYRGAMFAAGMICQDCHGTLTAVGGKVNYGNTGQIRRPWIDLPKCQSCHTGDAVSHLGTSIILRQTFASANAASAFPRNATNKRFAEENGKTFKDSVGHHGVACESCHGSPHAIWPTNQPNDALAATQIQGHTGQISECVACHGSPGPGATLGGPHGLHGINNASFTNGGHDGLYESNQQACIACHGAQLAGTVLSRAQANRTFKVEGRTVNITKGTPVHCSLCHDNPLNGG
jgi:hypothetical protein